MANTVSNAQTVAFDKAVKATASLGKAESSFAARVAELKSSGIAAADLKGDGRLFGWAQRRIAELTLTSAQLKIWADETLAQSVTKNGKRADTQRGKLVKQVNTSIKRIRDALAKEPTKKGTQAKRATPTESFFAKIDAMVKQLSNDKASATFEFDPILARKHLVAMIKELK